MMIDTGKLVFFNFFILWIKISKFIVKEFFVNNGDKYKKYNVYIKFQTIVSTHVGSGNETQAFFVSSTNS